MRHQITRELSTNSGDNFVDIGPVIAGNSHSEPNNEAWKRQISQFFLFKINDLKIASESGEIARVWNLAVHKSPSLICLIGPERDRRGTRNRLFYQADSAVVKLIACLKFVQCSRTKGKSRFTKRFCLFSTVFVDNFVENDVATSARAGDKVYLSQSILTFRMDFTQSNQALGFFSTTTLS
ncbi:hypothetical protein [Pseudoduganella lutea]|uniref:Uncharacterized protein n=1 Tax=Pseudoduganella lutea TaxID=321985 RepID=A0A4P6KYG4_9BURK|nr:hypothetical protein [Pseudoduganella lutea]QBE63977.1 hypothetical protein EWM63_14060 [Pseudoduganella lutea]